MKTEDASSERQQLLDRLVDNELSEAERRELLLALEQDPHGWRQCALAFLEAQAWRSELSNTRHATREVAAAPPSVTLAVAPATEVPTPSQRRWSTNELLRLAAAVLFAFGIGFLVRQPRGGVEHAGVASRPRVVAQVPETTGETPSGEKSQASQELGTSGELPGEVPAEPTELALVTDGDESSDLVLPIVDRQGLETLWADEPEAEIPSELVQLLGQSGHEVRTVRELHPVRLEDGRPALLPMDRLEVRYVADQFQ